jgi:hypothetical protein
MARTVSSKSIQVSGGAGVKKLVKKPPTIVDYSKATPLKPLADPFVGKFQKPKAR